MAEEEEQDDPSEDIVIQDSNNNNNSGQALSKRRYVKKTRGVATHQQQKLVGSPTEPKLPLGTAPVTIALSPQMERLRWWTERSPFISSPPTQKTINLFLNSDWVDGMDGLSCCLYGY